VIVVTGIPLGWDDMTHDEASTAGDEAT